MTTAQAGQSPRRVTATEAKNGLSALLDEVLSGRSVLITRNGRAIVSMERAPVWDSEVADGADEAEGVGA